MIEQQQATSSVGNRSCDCLLSITGRLAPFRFNFEPRRPAFISDRDLPLAFEGSLLSIRRRVNPLRWLVFVVLPLPNRNFRLDAIDKALASLERLLAMRRTDGNDDTRLGDIDSTKSMDRSATIYWPQPSYFLNK